LNKNKTALKERKEKEAKKRKEEKKRKRREGRKETKEKKRKDVVVDTVQAKLDSAPSHQYGIFTHVTLL
jgi:hypothetical protein